MQALVPNNGVDYTFEKVSNHTKYFAEQDKIDLSCRSSCPDTNCDDTQVLTIYEKEAYFDLQSSFEKDISIFWERKMPSVPSVTISCRPTMALTELILYMMSSV